MNEKIREIITDELAIEEGNVDRCVSQITALFASELADYKELCEKYKKLCYLITYRGDKFKRIELRMRIKELETKIKEI